jgi:hypothetical protein
LKNGQPLSHPVKTQSRAGKRIWWHSFGGRASGLKSRRVSGWSAHADRKHEESRAVASGQESIREQGTGANAKKLREQTDPPVGAQHAQPGEIPSSEYSTTGLPKGP